MSFRGFEQAPRRRVDLRGQSRNEETRAEVTTRLKREKEKRKRRILQDKSAAIIQLYWKRYSCRKHTVDLIREQWMATYGRHAQSLTKEMVVASATCVPQVVYFVKSQNVDDILCLQSTCRCMLEVIVAPIDMDLQEDGNLVEQDFSLETIDRIIALMEKCLRVLQENAKDWSLTFLCAKIGASDLATNGFDILDFMLQVLSTTKWKEKSLVDPLLQRLSEMFCAKGVFNRLNCILKEVVKSTGVKTIGGSLLEELFISIFFLEKTNTDFQNHSIPSSEAFYLWSIPCLSVFSPGLAQQRVSLLSYSLPYLKELCQSSSDSPSSCRRKKLGFLEEQSCHVFSNLLDLDPEEFPKSSEGIALLIGITQFMSFVISQHKPVYQQQEQKDMESSEEDSDSLEHFKQCVGKFMSNKGQDFLMSLINALLSNPLSPVYSCQDPYHQEATSAFFQVLEFVFSIHEDSERQMIVRSFPLSGKLAEFAWFSYIKKKWAPYSQSGTRQVPSSEIMESLVAPATILSEIYGSMLLIASESDLREGRTPLPLDEIYNPDLQEVDLITVLKNCFWSLTWKDSEKERSSKGKYINFPKQLGRLLRQLYDLCLKWDLVPAEHFHVQPLQVSRFVQQTTNLINQKNNEEEISEQAYRSQFVLKHAPYLIPFIDRARIFQTKLESQKTQRHGFQMAPSTIPVFKIRRSYFLEDAFDTIGELSGEDLRKRIRVQFIDSSGLVEAGVDGGGLFKDFLDEFAKIAFSPDYGLFTVTEQQEIYPNPAANELQSNALQNLSFLGKIVGKAVYEGILLDLPFAHFFLKKFRREICDLNDLPSLDRAVYTHLKQLKESKSQLHDYGLTFTITYSAYGNNEEVELKPGGRQISVTSENVMEYIYRFAHHRLNKQTQHVCNAFLKGFFEVIDPDWVQMFNANELQMLISGSLHGVDMEDLKKSVVYAGGYHEDHPVIHRFWEVMHTITEEEQRLFLRFVTGSSRAPLLGFQQLHPKICIRMSGSEEQADIERLPTAATCANLLKLPPYPSRQQLQEKLICAISSNSGFELS